ncbi:MAG TPA: lytic transglycosylase domain-containing protein [Chloroflexota bacterium]
MAGGNGPTTALRRPHLNPLLPVYAVIGGLLLAASFPFIAPAAVASGASVEAARPPADQRPRVVVVSSSPAAGSAAPARQPSAAQTRGTSDPAAPLRQPPAAPTRENNQERWGRSTGGTTTTSLTLLPRRTADTIVATEAKSAPSSASLPNVTAGPAAASGATSSPAPAAAATARPMPYVETALGAGVPASIRKYEEFIQRAAREYNVDPNFVAAVIMTESSGDPEAVSHRNAVGLMQVLDGPMDPEQNVFEGTQLLGRWLKYFGRVDLALAAYNAGPGNVIKYGGVPPFAETHNHIARTMARYATYSGGVAAA